MGAQIICNIGTASDVCLWMTWNTEEQFALGNRD